MQDIRRRGRVNARLTTDEPAKEKPPENLFQLLFQTLSRFGRLRKLLIALLILCSGGVFFWSLFPEQGKQTFVDSVLERFRKPPSVSYPGVEIEQQNLKFDLTQRVAAVSGTDPSQCCKVITEEYLTCRRVQKDAAHLARHAATTGVRPEFFSQTHRISVQQVSHERIGGPQMTDYDILLDISGERVGHPFTAHLRSVRFGSFRNEQTEWAAAAVLQPTRALKIEVIFPNGKRGRNFRFSTADESDGSNYVRVEGAPQVEVGDNRINWVIPFPKLGYTYRIDWDW